MKAVALMSGGLDSTLAVKLILNQGIQMEGINFLTTFCTCTPRGSSCLASQKAAAQLGVKVKVFNISGEYVSIVKRPKYGYGSGVNPCLDCRIFMFKKAVQYMREKGARFLVTGEVVGQRPMSQRRDTLRLIEKEVDVEGLVLRPLSAKILPPTIPEKRGWVNRNKLLGLSGRSRKKQFNLIHKANMEDDFCPSGGCLLTDPVFSEKMKDLLKFQPEFDLNDVQLLKLGRHFRLSSYFKAIVGRNEEENKKLENLAREGDYLFQIKDFPGPLTLGRGEAGEGEIRLAAFLTAKYSKAKSKKKIQALYNRLPDLNQKTVKIYPSSSSQVKNLRVY